MVASRWYDGEHCAYKRDLKIVQSYALAFIPPIAHLMMPTASTSSNALLG
jgi:hypothetical protein